MSGERKIFRAFEAQTAASPESVAAVRERLRTAREHDAGTARVLRQFPGATARALVRVRSRIAAGRIAVAQPWKSVRWGFAAALAASIAVAIASMPRWRGEGEPDRRLAGELASEVAWSASAPTPEVALRFLGSGRLTGDAQQPVVRWDLGTLDVDVTPDRGVELAVVTREARVDVVGTGFTVTRDILGTHVRVRHGRVSVACGSAAPVLLDPGEERACHPVTASGMLGRANRLAELGAPPAEILAALDRGLLLHDEDPSRDDARALRDELVLLRAESLHAAGRPAEALAAAAGALPTATTRATDLRRVAARAAMASTGCEAALPYLADLRPLDATGPELVQYADCVAADAPELARSALEAALATTDDVDRRQAIEARLGRLDAD